MEQKKWTIKNVISKFNEIKAKGYISIPTVMYRSDEGVVGQILEREFGITEDNLANHSYSNFARQHRNDNYKLHSELDILYNISFS